MNSEDEEGLNRLSMIPDQDRNVTARELKEQLRSLRACYNLMRQHGSALEYTISGFQTDVRENDEQFLDYLQTLSDRTMLFAISSRAMMKACSKFLQSAESDSHRVFNMLQFERERTRELEQMLIDVAKQHTQLERKSRGVSPYVKRPSSSSKAQSDDDEDFSEDNNDTKSDTEADVSEVDSLHVMRKSIRMQSRKSRQTIKIKKPSVKDSLKTPVSVPSSEIDSAPVSKKSRKTAIESVSTQASAPVSEPTRKSVSEPASKSVSEPASKLVSEPASKSVSEPASKSVSKPVTTTITESVLHATRKRRSRVPDRPNISVNAWSLLKNSIGKDLSKIPMPVNFNEPLSLLQRLTEEMEYFELLDVAANIENKCEQIAYIAAFSVSAYASTTNRTAKPFNPLLYETYECDRTDDLGWRSIAEQVSHHPPISALHCEGRGWTCWQETSIKMKFKGKNLQIIPTGSTVCKFEKTGNTYSWNKVTAIVNNIIVGKMWLDQQGQVEIKGLNAAAGINCTLNYYPFSIFSRENQRRVKGYVSNEKNLPVFIVQGYWDSHVEIAPKDPGLKNSEPERESFKTIWRRRLTEPGSEKYHYFSKFTCELNEQEEGVAPTDSRERPDLRLMEQGHWDESNVEKLRLEQKQRHKRRRSSPLENVRRSTNDEDNTIDPHEPLWFKRIKEDDKIVHKYNGEYWEAKKIQDWSKCPDIF